MNFLLTILLLLTATQELIAEQPLDIGSNDYLKKTQNESKELSNKLKSELASRQFWVKSGKAFTQENVNLEESRLLRLLHIAKESRDPQLVPLLSKWVFFSPYDFFNPKEKPPYETRFPVADAIIAIGTPAVNHMIDQLEIAESDQQRVHAITILIKIYGDGSIGQAMAKHRLELAHKEAETEGKVKKRLAEALNHRLFKIDIPDP